MDLIKRCPACRDEGDGRIGLVRHCWFPVEVLGPGRRLGVWFQGCSRCCPACFSPHTREFDSRYAMSLETLMRRLRKAALFTDRLTVSGGEPFSQPRFLYNFFVAARDAGMRDILVYSGFDLVELESNPATALALTMADVLIDGAFRADLPTRRWWRGSANQRLHLLSRDEEIRGRYLDFIDTDEDVCRMQIANDSGEDFVIGIPRAPLDIPILPGGGR